MRKPEKPKSQTQEVLYYLITRINITRRQMMLSCGVLNLPDQIMRLRVRYGLTIDMKKQKTTNKFGRETDFAEYSIKDKKRASEVYKTMRQENK